MAEEALRKKRGRGRPPKNNGREEDLKKIIVEAAKSVCCDHGIHGLTVERMLRVAGISRPTFYKFFRNKDDVLDIISRAVNQRLVDAVSRAFIEKKPDEDGIVAFVDAYLNWGMDQGPIVGRLYQGIKDDTGPLARNREITVQNVISVCQEAMLRIGRPAPDPLLMDALIYTGEYLCNPLFTNEHSREYYNRVRKLVIESMRKLLF